MLNYMDRQALPQTATELKERYGISDTRYGAVERGFSLAFAAGSVAFGLVADRVGPRVLYPVVLVGWSAAGLATPLLADPAVTRHLEDPGDPGSGPYRWLLLCRTLLGLFEAGHWPCALITVRQILAARDRPLGNGILQSGASLGAVLVPLYVLLVRRLGGSWEVVFWTIGAAGLVWVPVWLVLVRPGDLAGRPGPPAADAPAVARAFRWGAFLRMYLALFVVVSCLNVSWQFLRAWLPKYLKESQGFGPDATDLVVAAYYIAADLGCLASGFLVRFLVARGRATHAARLTGFALFAGVTLLAAVVPVAGGGWPGVGLIVLAGAGILGLHPYYYAFVQELPERNMGLLSGLLAAGAWVAAGLFQGAIGAHIDATKSYDLGFVVGGLAPLVGLAALLALWRPTRRDVGA
jgi:ACS family hexuronate transporter-like MFS transporter